jgi:hypothetical protein
MSNDFLAGPGWKKGTRMTGKREREARILLHAPEHLTLTEIAEMLWDKLDRPHSVLAIDSVSVSTVLEED